MANANQTAKAATDETVAAAKENMNKAVEAGRQAFERNAEVGRDAFKKSVDSTVSAFGELSAASKRNLEAFADSAAVVTETAQTLGGQAAAFAKSSMEEQVATARKLAGARTFQEAWDIQTGYAKSAFDAYLAEANRWTETVTASTQQAWKPINERVQATAEQFTVVR